MKIAITGAAGVIGRSLVPFLSQSHDVSPSDLKPGPSVKQADVLNPEAIVALCDSMDAVIHLAAAHWQDNLSDHENATRILDTRLKGTYNILHAAMQAEVKRVIQVSDVCVYNGYDEDLIVSEDFLPLPDTSAYQQSVYLSELVGREFARLSSGLVMTLRLGKVVDISTLTEDIPLDESWIDIQDALAGIAQALEIEHYDGMGHWGLYNLVGDIPNGRYSLHKTKTGHYGFHPVQTFEAWGKEGVA